MIREIEISVNTIDDITISSGTFAGTYKGKRLFAGREGEDDATRLSLRFGSAFDGYTMYLVFDVGGAEYTTSGYTDDFDYDIPSEYMVAEAVPLKIRAVNGDQILISKEIVLWVQRQ